MSNQRTGKITRIPVDRETGARKGFGFLKDDADGSEWFFHRSALGKGVDFESLPEGAKVGYAAGEDTGKGPRAAQVSVLP